MNRIFLVILAAAAIVVVLLQAPAEAFWGFGSGRDKDGSGLDLARGYDRNTVLTISGRVAVAPDPAGDPVTVVLTVGTERITVVLGPRWYLQDDDLAWKPGDTVTVRGSQAIGKDGRSYMLAQWISGPGGGTQMMLRSDTGNPGWVGGSRGSKTSGTAGQPQQGSGMGSRRMR